MPTEAENPADETPQQPQDAQEAQKPQPDASKDPQAEEFDDSEPAQDFTEEAEEALDDLPEWATQQLENMDQEEQADQPGEPVESSTPEASDEPSPEPEGPDVDVNEYKEAAPNLDLMLDLPLDVTVELGRAELPLAQVLELNTGSVVQLDRLPGEPLDLYVNDQLVARGEVIVLNETFAFRITDLIEAGKQRQP